MSFHFKHQLEEDNAKLEKQNKALRELIIKSIHTLGHMDMSTQCIKLYDHLEEKLKEIDNA